MKTKPQGTSASIGWKFVSLHKVLEGGLVWCFPEPGTASPFISVLLPSLASSSKIPTWYRMAPKLQPFCMPSSQQEGMREKGRKATGPVSLRTLSRMVLSNSTFCHDGNVLYSDFQFGSR